MAAKSQQPITMDSRKFLGAINSSLQSKVAVMEERVRELGRQGNFNWRLTSLGSDNLFIEDVDNRTYYGANYRREKGGNVVIENVRPIRIVESKKRTLFEANCKQLIDALEANDQRQMSSAFSRMAAQRFSARTVPHTGLVKTHDNVTRLVSLASESIVDESVRPRLVAAIVEGLTSKVTMHEGVPVRGTFSGNKLRLPISEWLCSKSVARHMRRIAESAYMSNGFQSRVYDVAKLIYEDKVTEAVALASTFLAENQEFTALNREQTKRLVENTLATRACFNQQLCNDTATLFWRTNLKVNRDTIIKEWRATARKASHPTLLENVSILERSANFEAAYDKFINLVFNEAVGPRDVQIHAYRTALKALKDTPKIKESNELSGKIDELIERLEQPESDHAVIAEVEDLLAEVKNEMNALESLDDFDKIPGGADDEESLDDLGGDTDSVDLGGMGGKSGTTVNFNINISGDGVSTGGLEGGAPDDDADLDDLLGDKETEEEPDEESGGDDDIEKLLGGGDEEEEEEGGDEDLASLLKGESRGTKKKPISESDDLYQYDSKQRTIGLGSDYGTKPIDIAEDCHRAVTAMIKIAEHNGIDGGSLLERAEELANAGIKAAGLIIPEHRKDQACEQICDAFFDELDRRGVELDEDQLKGPWRHVWSRKKVAINRREAKKGTRTESKGATEKRPIMGQGRRGAPRVEWVETQSDAKKGLFGGIGFIFDHANGAEDPILLSEDGQVEVPIPSGLHESAYAAADMSNGDPTPFIRWLSNNIEQLRPISEDESNDLDASINEAKVTIKTNPDGHIDVEVDSADPDINVGEPLTDLSMPPADDGLDAAPGMEPVDPMMPTELPPADDLSTDGEMPDFEGGSMTGDTDLDQEEEEEEPDVSAEFGAEEEAEEEEETEEEEEAEEEEEEKPIPPPPPAKKGKKNKKKDEDVVEDHDVTTPQTRKYNTTKQNHRKETKANKPGKSGDSLEGFGDGQTETPGMKMKKVTPKKGK